MYSETEINYTIQGRFKGETFRVKAHKLNGKKNRECRVEVIRGGGRIALVGDYTGRPFECLNRAFEDVFGAEL